MSGVVKEDGQQQMTPRTLLDKRLQEIDDADIADATGNKGEKVVFFVVETNEDGMPLCVSEKTAVRMDELCEAAYRRRRRG